MRYTVESFKGIEHDRYFVVDRERQYNGRLEVVRSFDRLEDATVFAALYEAGLRGA